MICLGIFLPTFLMAWYPIVMANRAYLMAVGGLYLLYILRRHGASLSDLGLTPTNFWPSLKSMLIPSILIIVAATLLLDLVPTHFLPMVIGVDPQHISSLPLRLFLYSTLSVPLQELVFRGFLVWRGKEIYSSTKQVFWMALIIFVGAHVPFYSPIMIAISAALGALYLNNYLRYGNLLSLIVSHAFVGSVLLVVRNYYLPF